MYVCIYINIDLEFMFTKFSVAIWNLLASTRAELSARLDDTGIVSWDSFLFTWDFPDNKGVKSIPDMYKIDLQFKFLGISIL